MVMTALALAGCASVAPQNAPMPAPTYSSEHVVERSYTLGREESAFVGGTLARVKDYTVNTVTRQGAIHASNDFTLFYPILGPRVLVRTTDPIRVVGTTERDGKAYRLVVLPHGPSSVRLLITDDGHFEGSGLGIGDARMGYNYSPDPPGVQLRPDTGSSVINTTAGYINFELVYSGATKDSIRLLYREFTASDLARPAFSQDLVYERDSPTIRFRNVLIKVLQATGEQLRYVVLDDGYPPQR